jgi:hypothetical protein
LENAYLYATVMGGQLVIAWEFKDDCMLELTSSQTRIHSSPEDDDFDIDMTKHMLGLFSVAKVV